MTKYTNYIVKTTYPEENEVTLTLFHHYEKAKDFIIETITESEVYDGTADEGDIEVILDDTNMFVPPVFFSTSTLSQGGSGFCSFLVSRSAYFL